MSKRGRSLSSDVDSEASNSSGSSRSRSRHAFWLSELRETIVTELNAELAIREAEESNILAEEAKEAELAFFAEFARQSEIQREIWQQELTLRGTKEKRTEAFTAAHAAD